MRSVTGVDIMPHCAGLTGDVAAPVVFTVTAVVCAVGVGGETPATAHHATPIHALRAGIAASVRVKEEIEESTLS